MKTKFKQLRPKSLKRKAGIPFLYELDLTIDDRGDLHNFFVIDLGNMAIGKSKRGDKLYSIDRALHAQISDSLEIDNISVDRALVPKRLKQNFLKRGVSPRNIKTPAKKMISNSVSKSRSLLKAERLIRTDNRNLKLKKVSFFRRGDTIKEKIDGQSSKVATIEQLDIEMDKRLRAIQFTDHEVSNLVTGEYAYILNVSVKDKYSEHVMSIHRDLVKFEEDLAYYKNSVVKNKFFNYDTMSMGSKFLSSFFRNYGVNLDEGTLKPSTTNVSETTLADSFIIKGIERVKKACRIINSGFNEKMFLNKINPVTCTPDSIGSAIRDLGLILQGVEKTYNIRTPSFTKGSSIGSKNSKTKNNITVEQTMNNTYLKKKVFDIGYKFFDFPKKKPLKITKSLFTKRSDNEVKKYFNGKPQSKNPDLQGFDKKTISKITDIHKDKYLHFTPQKIKIGAVEVDNSTLTKGSVDLSTFSAVQVARKLKRLSSDPDALPVKPKSDFSKKVKEFERTIEASDFLGTSSPTIFKITKAIKRKPSMLLKDKEVIKEIGVALFTHKDNKNKFRNISSIDMKNKDNIFSKSLKAGKIKPEEIPLQVRSLILSRSKSVRNKILEKNIDIFSNPLTSEMAFQNFGNIKKVQYLAGFEKSQNGTNNLSRPIFKDLSGENYNLIKGKSKLCKTVDVSNSLFSNSEEDDFDTLGNTFVLEDEEPTGMVSIGITTRDADHHHHYEMDSNGNGWTEYAQHPENENIRHRHQIVNGQIMEAHSNCYPACEDKYGVKGVGSHMHEFPVYQQTSQQNNNVNGQEILNSLDMSANRFSTSVVITQNPAFNSLVTLFKEEEVADPTEGVSNVPVGSPMTTGGTDVY